MLKPVLSVAAILRLRRPRVLSAQDIRMSSFDQFGLDPRILSAIERMGYTQPTPIQEKAIPVVLMGGDVMGAAQTGTGKTAGYGLPLIARILPKANTSMSPARHPVRALILAPTRELADQVSNSATAAMMVPIAIAVMGVIRSTQESPEITPDEKNFGVVVLLSIAYAASIGGMATLVGSPPNGIFARFVADRYHTEVSFLDWMQVALPVTLLLLPATFLLLNVLFPVKMDGIPGGREWIRNELRKLGPMSRGEKIVLCVFAGTALLWIFGPFLRGLEIGGATPLKPLTEEVIAMLAGVLLFIIPVDPKRGIHALDWNSAKDVVAWDVLLLFGGGLSMAAAIQSTGVASLIGAQAQVFEGIGELPMMFGVSTIVTFVSEVTSNTALAATMMPVIDAAAGSLHFNPEPILFATVFAASCAFMMPVGTPPNAIVFGTGRIRIGDMVKAGIWLNFIAVIIGVLVSYFFGRGIVPMT